MKKFSTIILAAGRGERIKRKRHKSLILIAGEPILEWTLTTLDQLEPEETIIVTRNSDDSVENYLRQTHSSIKTVKDPFFLGTGHSLSVGITALTTKPKTLLVLYSDDSFLYSPETLRQFVTSFDHQKAPLQIMTIVKPILSSVGGLKRDENDNASGFYTYDELKKNHQNHAEIVCGAFIFDYHWYLTHQHKIVQSKVTGELMLTSLITVAHQEQTPASVFKLHDQTQWQGVNTPQDLILARRYKQLHLKSGYQN